MKLSPPHDWFLGSVMILNVAFLLFFGNRPHQGDDVGFTWIGQAAIAILTFCPVFGRLVAPELGCSAPAQRYSCRYISSFFFTYPCSSAKMRTCFLQRFCRTWRQTPFANNNTWNGAAVGAIDSADEPGNTAIIWLLVFRNFWRCSK